MRPNPADPRCDLSITATTAAWQACPRLGDVASAVTSYLDEGFSGGGDARFTSDLVTGAAAERTPVPQVYGMVKTSGTGAAQRNDAYYKWARAKLFPMAVAVNYRRRPVRRPTRDLPA